MTLAVLFCAVTVFLLLGVPIGISLGAATAVTMALATKIPLVLISQTAFTGLDSFSLLAIPLFILAGSLMSYGGISRRLVALADSMVGGVCGGLAMVTVTACMFFSAISGSGTATVSAIGTFMIPEMRKKQYDGGFATAVTAAAGAIGVIIPPSIPFVIYGIVSGASIGELFLAGVLPGIVMGLALMGAAYFMAKKRGYPRGEKNVSWGYVGRCFREAFWAVLVPVIILGGIYGGVFTPTEAAGVAVVYSLVVGKFIYGELDLATTYRAFKETVVVTGSVAFMIGLSMSFAKFLTIAKLPQQLTGALAVFGGNLVLLLLAINVLLLIVGCFVDNFSAAIILTPILLPMVQQLGMDPVHFGIVMTVALAIGFITPPYGPNLFVGSAISGVSMEEITSHMLPFFLALLVALVLITYVPWLSMGLVEIFFR